VAVNIFEPRFGDRGGRGTVELNGESIREFSLGLALVGFAVTLVGFAAVVAGFATTGAWHGVQAGVGYVVYLLAGWFVRPKPDTSNLGWFGGLMNDPFRWSDDWNRFLVGLTLMLLPGYLLALPVARLFAWVAGEVTARR
jgi:hypothetical protein